MGSLPKPLIGLLVGTVAFFALWMVALKPSSSSSSTGGSKSGLGQYQSAINKAKGAVTTSNHANAKLGAPTATTVAPSSSTKPATKATTTATTRAAKASTTTPATKTTTQTKVAPAAKPAPAVSTAAQVNTVVNAVRDHKVLAVLFYNPAAADDRSMVSELSTIPAAGLPLVKVAVPVSELTKFAAITTKVPVNTSPTLVIIDGKGHAATLTGFAGTGEISQRIKDALASK